MGRKSTRSLQLDLDRLKDELSTAEELMDKAFRGGPVKLRTGYALRDLDKDILRLRKQVSRKESRLRVIELARGTAHSEEG